MKKLLCMLLVFAVLFSTMAVSVSAYNETEHNSGGFNYIIRNGEAIITGYIGSNKTMTIPAKLKGYKVTAVGDIESPYGTPLSGVENITTLVVGGNVRLIAESAFQSANKLTSVEIKSCVKQIGSGAFSNCTNLKTVKISNSVFSIGSFAFNNTAWYNNQSNGVVYAGKVAISYKGTMPSNYSLKLKSGTVGIASWAFNNQTNLVSIKAPSSLMYIGNRAFNNTKWLDKQDNGMVYIGKVLYTFKGTLPSSLTVKKGTLGIAPDAFCDGEPSYKNSTSSANLKKISLPNGLIAIGSGAFANCWQLYTITIPASVSYMEYNCFGFHNAMKGALWNDKETKSKLTIKGYKGSEAERYAKESDIRFASLGKLPAKKLAAPKITSFASVDTGVKISWGKVAGAVKYRVFYKSKNGWTKLGDITSTTLVDKAVKSGSTYTYTVRCINKAGTKYASTYNKSGWKYKYNMATPKITKMTSTKSGVKITWGAVKNAKMYSIFYLSKKGWVKMANVSGTRYTDKDVNKGKTYYYTVRCISSNGKRYTSEYNNKGWSHKY